MGERHKVRAILLSIKCVITATHSHTRPDVSSNKKEKSTVLTGSRVLLNRRTEEAADEAADMNEEVEPLKVEISRDFLFRARKYSTREDRWSARGSEGGT
jgi:hypothetical protein